MGTSTIRTAAPHGLRLRPVTDGDVPFLAELYASTRAGELAMVPWSAEQKRQFLASQFEFQRRHYREHYPDCECLIVERAPDGEAIGRLYVDRWPDQIRIVDIALVPACRGQRIGTALLGGVMAEAQASRVPVTIHVEHQNPARRLYERLGFREVDTSGVYALMRWSPDAEQ